MSMGAEMLDKHAASYNRYTVNFGATTVFIEPEVRRRKGGPKPLSAADRVPLFWSYVKRGRQADCWLWEGHCLPNGYGAFHCGRVASGKQIVRGAHIIAYVLTHGAIPAGHEVCHACDIPACCNPQHLFVGTRLDNARDAHRKGRYGRRPNRPRYDRALIQQALDGPRGTISSLARQHGLHPHYFRLAVMRARKRHASTTDLLPVDELARSGQVGSQISNLSPTETSPDEY